MLTLTMNVPENQVDGAYFVNEIDHWLKNPSIFADRRYFFYKEAVEDDTMQIAFVNFPVTIKTESEVIATVLKRHFGATIQ